MDNTIVEQAHIIADLERDYTALKRKCTDAHWLLIDALSALTNGKQEIAAEFIERAIKKVS